MIKCEITDFLAVETKQKKEGDAHVEIKGNFPQVLNEAGMLLAAIIQTYAPRAEKIAKLNEADKEERQLEMEMTLYKMITDATINFLIQKETTTSVELSKLKEVLGGLRHDGESPD